jgi:hypothetical protein
MLHDWTKCDSRSGNMSVGSALMGETIFQLVNSLLSKLVIGQPTYEKVNEDLLLDKPLRVIQNHNKLAYRI